MAKTKGPKCESRGCKNDAAGRVSISLPIADNMASMLGELLGGLDPRNFLTYRGVKRFYLCLMHYDLLESNDAFRGLISWEHL
jgi:hypothetical protein